MRSLISTAVAFFAAVAGVAQAPPEAPKYSVPDLQKRATLFIKPAVPDVLLMDELDGKTIVVRVLVDASGNVEVANATLGFSEQARLAAEQAARESKFEPLVVRGKAERYAGTLNYSFAYEKMDWWAFGTMLESVHNFDNISVAPVADKLTIRWAEEKSQLAAIDRVKDIDERIKTIASMIAHFRSKLTGRDRWLFSAAVAVRNVTFWPMAMEKIDRVALQNGLAAISTLTNDAPPAIPAEFVDAIRQMAAYKIDPTMDESKLRDEIMKFSMGLRNYPR